MQNNKIVEDEEFISMMQLWTYKAATYPLEVITLLNTENNEKLIAIQDYIDLETLLVLPKKSYKTYQSAMGKVGALMDKMDYPGCLNEYKAGHPMSCPAFCDGYQNNKKINPYGAGTDDHREWESGQAFRLSQANDEQQRLNLN